MSRSNSIPKKSFNPLVALVAILWITAACGLFLADLLKTHRIQIEDPVVRRNTLALAPVKETSSGWFPGEYDSYFSWNEDTQGWKSEKEDPLTLTPNSPEIEKSPAVSVVGSANTTENPNPLTLVDPPVSLSSSESSATQSDQNEDLATRGKVLSVPVDFPDPATIYRDNNTSLNPVRLGGVRYISYDVYVPPDASGFIGCLFFLKDKDGLWYQARSHTALLPGRWTTLAADLRGESPDVTALGHLGQWDENQATLVKAVGITFYGDKPYQGRILVDNFRGWMRPQRFQQMLQSLNNPDAAEATKNRWAMLKSLEEVAEKQNDPPLKILNFRTTPSSANVLKENTLSIKKFETLTLSFELNRQVNNPFDPEKADIRCLVTTPSGSVAAHLGFWYQEYERTPYFSGEELMPVGRPEWRVRITPREEGVYQYTLTARLAGRPKMPMDEVTLSNRSFKCVAAARPGFVRISEKDSRFFEFDNGDFFYPIGHNLHSPVDIRCWREVFKEEPVAGRGLPMYDDYFKTMQKNGENTAEVWMAAWWVGIEWTSKWRNYYGPKRYSLLKMAQERGIYIHLVLDNHGKFSSWCDWEWDLNPYNSQCEPNEGVVTTASAFFTNDTARKWHRNRLRYIAARWGADPTILGWELVSEFDLVGGTHRNDSNARNTFHRSATLQNWAKEMITHLRRCDVYLHPITNHYATDFNYVDLKLARQTVEDEGWDMKPKSVYPVPVVSLDPNSPQKKNQRPLFDYVVTDAYRADRGFTGIALRSQQWFLPQLHRTPDAVKPFWITEYGGDWNAATADALDADAQCGLWASWMTDAGGTPLFWWYDLIQRRNLYTYFRAFSNYIKGEDRRGIKGTSIVLSLTAGIGNGGLRGNGYRWNTGAYAWFYSITAMEVMPPLESRPIQKGLESMISDLEVGKYRVEYWDCYEGIILKHEDVVVDATAQLTLKFPPFKNNSAV
jgi:hypothetical protein